MVELPYPILASARRLFRDFRRKSLQVKVRCPRCGRVLAKWSPDSPFLGALAHDSRRGVAAALTADQTPPYRDRVSYWCRTKCSTGPVSTLKAESIVELLLSALRSARTELTLP